MANNRLYVVDTTDNSYIMIAKNSGDGWLFGNAEYLDIFLGQLVEHDSTNLIFVTENDTEMFDKYVMNGKDAKEGKGWHPYFIPIRIMNNE